MRVSTLLTYTMCVRYSPPEAPKGLFYGRSFAEKSAAQTSQYGPGSVALETARTAPKPVVPVNQANKLEVLHYPVERFTSTTN